MRTFLLGVVVVLASLASALAGYLAVNELDPARPGIASAPSSTPGPARAIVAATVAPTPTSVPLPDRDSCDEIRGTEYRSGAEQVFFNANCLPPPAPPVAKPAPPAVPGPEVAGERWILVDLARQEASAMIGDEKLYTALVTTGKEGWETPAGTWYIVRRVANETMTSVSIGAEEFYELKDVLYTQYFTNVGHALHTNYWRDDSYFGEVPSSHGCVGMRLADAEFFWRFAGAGTRVTIK
ncbi:MAG: L,D-transpeptidase family protein [Dehalococcoidia bacterium]|nr:L,D-transpeptidase family protein [Dehalococcoidia bacterium]